MMKTAALAAALFALAGCSPSAEDFDISVTKCDGSGSVALVEFTVTNLTDETESPVMGIEYRGADGIRLDVDDTWVQDIRPGDTARHSETTWIPEHIGTISCHVFKS